MMPEPARHLHFVQSIEPLQGGGLGRAALELHHAFIQQAATSSLVATHGSEPQARNDLSVREFRRAGPAMLYFSPDLRAASAPLVQGADIVHAHGLYTMAHWMLGSAARRQDRALVYHVHGFFEPWILARSRARKRLVHGLFEDANFKHARLWRALTSKEAEQIRAQGITAPIVVAANGIDLAAFDATSEAIASSPFAVKSRRRMLFLARLHPKKGLGLLIPAWARVRQEARDWELVIAGPDELGHLAEAQSLVKTHELENEIRFTGAVTGADKLALLRSADAFILPSHSEGFSVAILEAMACRVPVAATHACNFPELDTEGGGWLCQAEPEAVTKMLIQTLSTSDSERRDRGLAARRLVEQRYTWPSIARTILDACATHCRFG
ncbi:MAG: glycosyltransferase [Opitutaceae bacterium]